MDVFFFLYIIILHNYARQHKVANKLIQMCAHKINIKSICTKKYLYQKVFVPNVHNNIIIMDITTG